MGNTGACISRDVKISLGTGQDGHRERRRARQLSVPARPVLWNWEIEHLALNDGLTTTPVIECHANLHLCVRDV